MAYDSHRRVTVLFGGAAGVGTSIHFADTWEWDGSVWSQRFPATVPDARLSHAMVYDSLRGRTVLFGGRNATGLLGGTWEWDGVNWTSVPSGPPARHGHAMAYDSQRNRTVLFGGYDGSPALVTDTWEWDGVTWTQRASSGPSERYNHTMAYDSNRHRTVLYGGWQVNNVVHFGDTWEWDGSQWTQVATVGPSARRSEIAYDSHRRRTVLFGGHNQFGGNPSGYLDDTWEWDGRSWQQVMVQGPVARTEHSMVYDSNRGNVVMFGGYEGAMPNYLSDTWRYGIPVVPSSATVYGAGCGPGPLLLVPVVASPPIINSTAQALLINVPSSVVFMALGLDRLQAGPIPLPFHLVGYGMPGCWMLHSAEVPASSVTIIPPGMAMYSLRLPSTLAIVGSPVYLQGWSSAPGANTAGLVVSNGLSWVIGN